MKISLFDVSNPASPKEKSTYTLSEYWSEVLNTHHAFLQDLKHSIFFMPGGQGGYIFSYAGGTLTLKRAVEGQNIKRALFIDDFLYIVGDLEIIVLDENNWNEVKRLRFDK